MSTARDLMWYRTVWNVTQTTGMEVSEWVTRSVDANSTTNIIDGPVLGDAHKRLRGTIEDIRIITGNTNAGVALSMWFFRASGRDASTYTEDRTLDYVEVVEGGFNVADVTVGVVNSQKIHHFNSDGNKKFYIAVRNDRDATTDMGGIVAEWSFRPDLGGR